MDEEEFLRVRDVARILKVTRNTVYRWAANGKLMARQSPTGMMRIQRTDLEAFLQVKMPQHR